MSVMNDHENAEMEIDQINDIFTALRFAYDRDINTGTLETLEELKMLLLTHLRKSRAALFDEDGERTLKETLEEDYRRLTQLKQLYNDLEEFCSSATLEESLKQELGKYIPGYMDRLKMYMAHLETKECPIVIAGETSAGKSTILNLLLGESLLPESVLHSTTTVSHVKNGDRKSVTIIRHNFQRETHVCDEDASRETLENIIGRTPPREIFITWPIKLLPGHVSIVDTPGIGEKEMTERVLEILQRAAAFIFVVNSANAGGLLKNRLIDSLKDYSKTIQKVDFLETFDPQSAIFVLNKWDTIPAEEAKDVENKIFKTLQQSWPGLNVEQLYKLSATEAFRCIQSGAGYTKSFTNLWEGIKKLIPVSLKMNSRTYYTWLCSVLKVVHKIISLRVSIAKKTHDEKQFRRQEYEKRLEILQDDADLIMAELGAMITEQCNILVDDLHAYLRTPEVLNRLTTWEESECPDSEPYKYVIVSAKDRILERIHSILYEWNECTDSFNRIKEELMNLFKEKFKILDEEFSKWEKELNFIDLNDLPQESKMPSNNGSRAVLSRTESILLGVTSPLWAPIALVGTVIALPILGGLAIKETCKQKMMLVQYRNRKSSFMSQWTIQTIEQMTKDDIKAHIVDKQMHSLRQILDKLQEMIPHQLECDKELIRNVVEDVRSSTSILKVYTPLQKQCRIILSKCRIFRLKHFDTDKLSCNQVEINERLGTGTYADVYRGIMRKEGQSDAKVAIKVLRDASDLRRDQTAEVDVLRNLKHKNIVSLYGVVCEDHPVPCLFIIMELCTGTLEDYIFEDDRCVPARFSSTCAKGVFAFDFYRRMLIQILSGLEFIHKEGYVHRDLKLSNILLTSENIIKIADVGLTAFEFDITGTLCGTWTHVAPEVIQSFQYGHLADIYSIGIIMWEMWYGAQAYSDLEGILDAVKLIMSVVEGLRPSFDKRHKPHTNLMNLMHNCWKKEPNQRPSASLCLQIIASL